MEDTTKNDAPQRSLLFVIAFSLVLINPIASLISAGNYIEGTFLSFGCAFRNLPFIFTFAVSAIAICLILCTLQQWGHSLTAIHERRIALVSSCAAGLLFVCGLIIPSLSALIIFAAIPLSLSVLLTLKVWLRIFTRFDFASVLFNTSASLCLAALVAFLVLTTSNQWIILATIAISPCCAVGVLFVSTISSTLDKTNLPFTTPPVSESTKSPEKASALSFFGNVWPLVMGLLLCLFLLGFTWSDYERASQLPFSAAITQGSFGGAIITSAILAAVARLYPRAQKLRIACSSFIPLIITLPLATCIFAIEPQGFAGYILGSFTGIAFVFFAALALAIAPESESRWGVPLMTTIGACCIAASIILMGSICLNRVIDPGQSTILTLSVFVAYLAALATRTVRTNAKNEFSQATAPAEQADDPRTQTCEHLAQVHHLSPREIEVLNLLAKGRSSTYIAQELYVSPETVKVHIKHIYEKIGVHSRQELFDLFE